MTDLQEKQPLRKRPQHSPMPTGLVIPQSHTASLLPLFVPALFTPDARFPRGEVCPRVVH